MPLLQRAKRALRGPETPAAASGRRRLGQRSEALARHALASRGYAIEAVNVRYPVGELDVVAREGSTLCFIEVRSTGSDRWGGPLASIDDRKRSRLIRAARWYLARLREPPEETRFDVVGITWSPDGSPQVELVRGAFEAP